MSMTSESVAALFFSARGEAPCSMMRDCILAISSENVISSSSEREWISVLEDEDRGSTIGNVISNLIEYSIAYSNVYHLLPVICNKILPFKLLFHCYWIAYWIAYCAYCAIVLLCHCVIPPLCHSDPLRQMNQAGPTQTAE